MDMSEKQFRVRFEQEDGKGEIVNEKGVELTAREVVACLNEQQATISKLEEERGYWKSKAMTLLMQVRRLTSRMTDKEVEEFSKELEDEL